MKNLDYAIDTSMDEGPQWKTLFGYFSAFLIGIFGSLVGGACGWAMGQGTQTLIGAGIGFGVFFCFGFMFFGPMQNLVNHVWYYVQPPEALRVWFTGARSFNLYVTVHSIQNVINMEGIAGFFGKVNDSFIELKVGREVDEGTFIMSKNPPKRTCVRTDGKFNEVFHFVIQPTDDTLQVTLFDQDVVGESLVGTQLISITEDVLQAGFPQKRGFRLQRVASMFSLSKHAHAGTAILSFQPGDNFPKQALEKVKKEAPVALKTSIESRQVLGTKTEKAGSYGTWATQTLGGQGAALA